MSDFEVWEIPPCLPFPECSQPGTGVFIREKNFEHGLDLGLTQTSDFYPWGMADPNVFNISNATGTLTVNLMPTGIVEVH